MTRPCKPKAIEQRKSNRIIRRPCRRCGKLFYSSFKRAKICGDCDKRPGVKIHYINGKKIKGGK